ncbi:hypothetical protein [Terriglobus sp. TAA 43]|uniref:hypothetical protein n=1 Tax=Terriglobus sp. TAA 43 TaxID=278961 RepID=UPI000648F76A|nr:hypothetical protein [Terriglobus sp. TAA 43]
MATFPLPALSVSPPQQQQDPLERYGRLLQLKNLLQNAPLQQQALQQQVEGGQLQLNQQRQQMQDQQTLRSLSPKFIVKDESGKVGYDFDGYLNAAASSGVRPETVAALQKSFNEGALTAANVKKTGLENAKLDIENHTNLNNEAFSHLEGLRASQNPEQRQQLWDSALQWASKNAKALGIDPSKLPQQAPDDNYLGVIEASLGMHSQLISDALKKSETRKNDSQADQAGATASGSLLKQYAPALAQSSSAQDYATKLQAFETLHPDLAGRFPRQFDQRNPQAVLNVGMTANELADFQQKERLAKFTQAQENHRAQLGRQTTFENSRMLHGMNQIDQYTADPQHGYGQFVSQAGAVKSAIQQAKNGNQLAASLEPMMLALGVSSFAGVHRINDAEINRAGPAVGSEFRKLDNLINRIGTGKPSDAQLREASSIVDSLISNRHSAYLQGVRAVAANTGLDPDKVTVFDRDGNITPLAAAVGGGAGGSARGGGGNASPQTHTFSLSAWKAANPRGDANAAKAAAEAQGFTVVQ